MKHFAHEYSLIAEKDWMLKGVIALGTGYIIAIICCTVCVCVKCINFLKLRYRQFVNYREREMEVIPEPIQLRLLSQNLNNLSL